MARTLNFGSFRLGAAMVVAAMVATAGALVPAVPASAAKIGNSCAEGYNPEAATHNIWTQDDVTLTGRIIELRVGHTDVHPMAWARIRSAHTGDRVWLDWKSSSTSADWYQCGPYSVGYRQSTRFTPAVKPSIRTVRACGDIPNGGYRCTAWYSY